MSPSPLLLFFYPPAWILQASHLLSDNAKAPGGENLQGRALSVQSRISAWGATEKVLDHQLDRDAALLLLRTVLWTMSHSPSWRFDTGQTENIGLGCAVWTNCESCIHLNFFFFFSLKKISTFQCNILNISETVICCVVCHDCSVVHWNRGCNQE